jgi:anti-anti-sigma regulatory factor
MKFYLIVASGKHQGLPIPIEVDLFLIGADPACQLRKSHPLVGERHCALITRERKVFIRDMGSGEPTYVNDDEVPADSDWPLHAGDHIKVGPLEFVIQLREKALSQRDLEEWALHCLDDAQSTKKMHVIDELVMAANAKTRSVDAAQAAAVILDKLNAKSGIIRGRLRIQREGNITIVRINDTHLVDEGELALIRKELHENLGLPNMQVLLDFKNVKRMSSTAAAMFGEISRFLRSRGSKLGVCRLRSEFRDMMATLLGYTIPIYHDKNEALAAQW